MYDFRIIKNVRLAKKLSQKELANLLYISDTQVYRYETGISEPSATMLYNIAKALQIPIDSFFTDTDTSFNKNIIKKLIKINEISESIIISMPKYNDININTDNHQRVPKKRFRQANEIKDI